MAQRAVKRSQSVVDPMFYIPEGTDEFVYSDEAVSVGDSLEETVIDDTFVGEDDYADYSDTPGVPDIMGVVSQTIRTTAAGNQVVDLVIEVDAMEALSKYEVRVTKI